MEIIFIVKLRNLHFQFTNSSVNYFEPINHFNAIFFHNVHFLKFISFVEIDLKKIFGIIMN